MERAWKLAILIAAATATPAQAATYCVNDPACPADGIVMGSVQAATQTANSSAAEDLVRVGAGDYTVPSVVVADGTRLVGAGRGKTFLRGGSGEYGPLGVEHASARGPATVSDLTVVLKDGNKYGVSLDEGGLMERVHVDGTALTTSTYGIYGGFGGTFRHGSIDMPRGVAASNGMSLEDSTVQAAVGFEELDYAGEIWRTSITAEIGAVTHGHSISVRDSTVRLVGTNPIGLRADGDRLGHSTIAARNVTIVGPGTDRGIGIQVLSDCARGDIADAFVDNVAIANLRTHIARIHKDFDPEFCTERTLTVRRSAYDPTRVVNEGPGTIDADPPVATDLKLIDLAGGDLRPRWDSPLIDAAGPSYATDIRGLPRGDAPDVGAFEYQFAAPVAEAKVVPGTTYTFDARGSTDIDGDPLTFNWSFSDGTTAQGARVNHTFGAGRHSATVTVTDPTGRSSTDKVDVGKDKPAPPNPPAPTPTPNPGSQAPHVNLGPPAGTPSKVTPRGIALRATRLRGRAVRYRLRGRIQLPAGVSAGLCAGGHVVVRVPTGPRSDRPRTARVRAGCRFSMVVKLPARSRGGTVRLYPLFRGAEGLAHVRGRITLRPR